MNDMIEKILLLKYSQEEIFAVSSTLCGCAGMTGYNQAIDNVVEILKGEP